MRLEPLPAREYAAYRREAIFAACKWDPQIGDVNVLADHALVLEPETAAWLEAQAECLAAEIAALEEALLSRPELFGELGLGGRLGRALRGAGGSCPSGVRLMRFDFHPLGPLGPLVPSGPLAGGWAVSEVNSDVPGGFGEAGVLPRLAASLLSGTSPAGPDPARAVAKAFAGRLAGHGRVALVHATAYSDDRQVMEYLAAAMREEGLDPILLAPDHLRLDDGRARSVAWGQEGEVHALFRFFPAEWLPNLSGDWRGFFHDGPPACNHAAALLCQSKRAPLVWPRLGVPFPAWRSLLPATEDPRRVDWEHDPSWILKPALGRVGEDVAVPEVLEPGEWKRIRSSARRHPRAWVAQRRFDSLPVETRAGERHVCVGVYTVDGKAAGFYARVAERPRIDQYAQDAPVLVRRIG